MNNEQKNIFYGLLIASISIGISLIVKTEDLDRIFFLKSIMIIVIASVTAILGIDYMKNIKKDSYNQGIKIGVTWFLISFISGILLSFILKIDIVNFIKQSGIRYLIIPIITISLGYVKK